MGFSERSRIQSSPWTWDLKLLCWKLLSQRAPGNHGFRYTQSACAVAMCFAAGTPIKHPRQGMHPSARENQEGEGALNLRQEPLPETTTKAITVFPPSDLCLFSFSVEEEEEPGGQGSQLLSCRHVYGQVGQFRFGLDHLREGMEIWKSFTTGNWQRMSLLTNAVFLLFLGTQPNYSPRSPCTCEFCPSLCWWARWKLPPA